MKKILILILLLLNYGCKSIIASNLVDTTPENPDNNSETDQKITSNQCPQQPPSTSKSETVDLTNSVVNTTIKLQGDRAKAYKFDAEPGKIFNHSYDKNICFWVYNPQGQLIHLEDDKLQLSDAGSYLVLLSVSQGVKTVNLEMSLQDKVQVKPPSRSQQIIPKQQLFSFADYPQNQCGDLKPSNLNDYPVKFYPVYVPYSSTNLTYTKGNLCRDSYKKRDRSTGQFQVQVASFLTKNKAEDFADFINQKIDGATVGKPKTYYEP